MSEILIDPFYLVAKQFAEERHSGQTRKDARATPYIEHPVAVASLLIQVGVSLIWMSSCRSSS